MFHYLLYLCCEDTLVKERDVIIFLGANCYIFQMLKANFKVSSSWISTVLCPVLFNFTLSVFCILGTIHAHTACRKLIRLIFTQSYSQNPTCYFQLFIFLSFIPVYGVMSSRFSSLFPSLILSLCRRHLHDVCRYVRAEHKRISGCQMIAGTQHCYHTLGIWKQPIQTGKVRQGAWVAAGERRAISSAMRNYNNISSYIIGLLILF